MQLSTNKIYTDHGCIWLFDNPNDCFNKLFIADKLLALDVDGFSYENDRVFFKYIAIDAIYSVGCDGKEKRQECTVYALSSDNASIYRNHALRWNIINDRYYFKGKKIATYKEAKVGYICSHHAEMGAIIPTPENTWFERANVARRLGETALLPEATTKENLIAIIGYDLIRGPIVIKMREDLPQSWVKLVANQLFEASAYNKDILLIRPENAYFSNTAEEALCLYKREYNDRLLEKYMREKALADWLGVVFSGTEKLHDEVLLCWEHERELDRKLYVSSINCQFDRESRDYAGFGAEISQNLDGVGTINLSSDELYLTDISGKTYYIDEGVVDFDLDPLGRLEYWKNDNKPRFHFFRYDFDDRIGSQLVKMDPSEYFFLRGAHVKAEYHDSRLSKTIFQVPTLALRFCGIRSKHDGSVFYLQVDYIGQNNLRDLVCITEKGKELIEITRKNRAKLICDKIINGNWDSGNEEYGYDFEENSVPIDETGLTIVKLELLLNFAIIYDSEVVETDAAIIIRDALREASIFLPNNFDFTSTLRAILAFALDTKTRTICSDTVICAQIAEFFQAILNAQKPNPGKKNALLELLSSEEILFSELCNVERAFSAGEKEISMLMDELNF